MTLFVAVSFFVCSNIEHLRTNHIAVILLDQFFIFYKTNGSSGAIIL